MSKSPYVEVNEDDGSEEGRTRFTLSREEVALAKALDLNPVKYVKLMKL